MERRLFSLFSSSSFAAVTTEKKKVFFLPPTFSPLFLLQEQSTTPSWIYPLSNKKNRRGFLSGYHQDSFMLALRKRSPAKQTVRWNRGKNKFGGGIWELLCSRPGGKKKKDGETGLLLLFQAQLPPCHHDLPAHENMQQVAAVFFYPGSEPLLKMASSLIFSYSLRYEEAAGATQHNKARILLLQCYIFFFFRKQQKCLQDEKNVSLWANERELLSIPSAFGASDAFLSLFKHTHARTHALSPGPLVCLAAISISSPPLSNRKKEREREIKKKGISLSIWHEWKEKKTIF